MTVEVINESKHQTTCYNCKSILSYQFSDTEEVKHRDYTGDLDIYRVINCPVCNYNTRVKL